MSLSVTFIGSICSYMCNFPESYPAPATCMHLEGRVEVTSLGCSGIIPNWIFKATACLFSEKFFLCVVVLLGFFPPLYCAGNFQTICRHMALKRVVHTAPAHVVIQCLNSVNDTIMSHRLSVKWQPLRIILCIWIQIIVTFHKLFHAISQENSPLWHEEQQFRAILI